MAQPLLPSIALVGRPNVGKSTLFNRLTRTRDALVANYPGLTRDRQYGVGQLGTCAYVVIDTGGLTGIREQGLAALMQQQVQQAITEADHILFLVDARDGCMVDDIDIAQQLRRTGKSLTLVVNKIDGLTAADVATEFQPLGFADPCFIAATQGRGLQPLLEQVCAALSDQHTQADPAADADTSSEQLRMAIIGRPNVGKSTLINRLLGTERVIASDTPGTTRDSILIPFQYNNEQYTLIDTAGVRRRARIHETIEKFSVIKTLQAIAASHVVMLVLDAQQDIGEQDAHLAAHALEQGRALVVAINKWDGLDPAQRSQVEKSFTRQLSFLDFAEQFKISARHGTGVGLLLPAAQRAYANATRDLATPLLTRLLEQAVSSHAPPLVHGRRIKLRYAHQGGRNPPCIVIHGNQTTALPEAYRRYLMNYFRLQLKLVGTPLRLEFKTGSNPFSGQRNQLTPRQVRQRRRLRTFVQRHR
jgi:GTP-binding protein